MELTGLKARFHTDVLDSDPKSQHSVPLLSPNMLMLIVCKFGLIGVLSIGIIIEVDEFRVGV